MKYFKIDNKTAIEYDEATQRTRILDVDILKQEKDYASEKLKSIPEPLSDAELLAWAKTNYQQTDYSVEIATLKKQKDEATELIDLIKAL